MKVLGIDLGTSSVKTLLYRADGSVEKSKASYDGEGASAWKDATRRALSMLDCRSVSAVGLSAQTGTYVIDGGDVIGWRCSDGKDYLDRVRTRYTEACFLREIAMPHPPLLSYPIPRLAMIKDRYGDVGSICQPKDYIVEYLTGARVSDYYTWRGLADPRTKRYSPYFLAELGIDESVLPPLLSPTDLAGRVTETVARETGIPRERPLSSD